MRLWAALVALVVGCSEPVAVDVSSGLEQDGGAPPMQSDGGFLPMGQDAALAGFDDAGRDAGGRDAGATPVVDAGVDAGPCYPPDGINPSFIPLECDACPPSGCLPIVWSLSLAGSPGDGGGGIEAVTAILSTTTTGYELRNRFETGPEPVAVVVTDGDFFSHLHQGQPMAAALHLEMSREPWTKDYSSLAAPHPGVVPSYMRVVAQVNDASYYVTLTMHRAPD